MKTNTGDLAPDEGHEKFAEMMPPFPTTVDREADYREAWRYFEGMRAKNLARPKAQPANY